MSLSYRVRIAANGLDVTPVTTALTVRHGRATVAEATPPNSCTFDLLDYEGPLRVADKVSVDVAFGDGDWEPWFRGAVTDHELEPYIDPATLEPVGRRRIVCVSDGLGRMARRRIGDEPWGDEVEHARIKRILDLCPDVTQGTIDDDGVIYFQGRDIDSQDAYRIVSSYAQEAWGMMYDARDGSVHYHSQYHRDPENDPVAVLYSHELTTQPKLAERVGGIINRARVGWGASDQVATATDDESIEQHGLYDFYQGTEINDQSSGQAIADLLVHLYAQPKLATDEIEIPVSRLEDAARAEALARLNPADYLSMFGWPDPAPNPWPVWVEGVVDNFEGGAWKRKLVVTDRYGAPVTEPPEPPDRTPCDEFDFSTECASDCLFPHGATLTGTVGSARGWDGDAWWVEAESESMASVSFLPIGDIYFGEPGPHPDPWTGGSAQPADFCVGYEGFRITLNGQPYDFANDPPVYEYGDQLVPTAWFPCRFVPLTMLASWEPTDGWGEGDATFADGSGPPLGWVTPVGCRQVRYSEYATLFPGTTRQHTRDGRWETSVITMLQRVNDSDPPIPLLAPVRLINSSDKLRVTATQHWARHAF